MMSAAAPLKMFHANLNNSTRQIKLIYFYGRRMNEKEKKYFTVHVCKKMF